MRSGRQQLGAASLLALVVGCHGPPVVSLDGGGHQTGGAGGGSAGAAGGAGTRGPGCGTVGHYALPIATDCVYALPEAPTSEPI